ncbi:MAG: tRNA lysidine(34) synthetase TilS [Thermaceae bacterium]
MLQAFRERLDRLAPKDPLVLAVSGGGDSVAMAHLVHALGREAVVAHLDHGLRPDSHLDAAFVEALAKRLGFLAFIERAQIPKGGNLEAKAREIRYAFLHRVAARVKGRAILTAHTLDDQAETVLLQLLKGTGRALGIREKQGLVVRPLLWTERKALRAYLEALGETWREDPTNQDPTLDRNYLRLMVLPLLEGRFPNAKAALGRFAEVNQEEDRFLDEEAARRLSPDPRFFVPAYRVHPLLQAPPVLRRRALRQLLEGLGQRPESRLIELLEEALRGRAATLPQGVLARRKGGVLFLLPPEPKIPLPPGFRRAEPGDYMERGRIKKRLVEVLSEMGLPKELKAFWPVKAEGKKVVEVFGLGESPMDWALEEARKAMALGEVPVGAVLIQGERVLRAHNRVEALRDPTAHAELLLLREAKEASLKGATLYVTLEPCLMCYGALRQAGVRVVYGTENLKEGALTRFGVGEGMVGGLKEKECAKLLTDFFRAHREGCRSG